jgi:hypothetical protein
MSEGRGQGSWNKWEGPKAQFAVGGTRLCRESP